VNDLQALGLFSCVCWSITRAEKGTSGQSSSQFPYHLVTRSITPPSGMLFMLLGGEKQVGLGVVLSVVLVRFELTTQAKGISF
jgi:hypothetical protein